MPIIIAIIIGLIINFYTGGLEFNSSICVIAGLFLIMPFLLKLKIKDIFSVKDIKPFIFKNLFNVFIISPIIFLGIGFLFFGYDKILFGFLLLSILSGGGLLLSWIGKNKGDEKLGFKLFIINFLIFNILFLILSIFLPVDNGVNSVVNKYSDYGLNYNFEIQNQNISNNTCVISDITNGQISCGLGSSNNSLPIIAFFVLIVIPFIVSRIIRLNKTISTFLLKHIKGISNIFILFLIAYIFSLKELNKLLELDFFIILKFFISTLLIYLFVFLFNYIKLTKTKKSKQDISIFWLSVTKYITLGLVFSFIYSYYIGIEIMLIFIFAYIFQLGLSGLFSKQINKLY